MATRTVERSNETVRSLRGALRRALLPLAGFSLGINLLMLTVPLFMLQVFDRVLASGSEDTLRVLLVIALGALLALGLLDAIRARMLGRIGGWIETRLGGELLAASQQAALASGNGTVQPLRDLQAVRAFFTGPAPLPLFDAPWVPVYLAVLFLLHPLLGWLSLAGALWLLALAALNEFATRSRQRRGGQAGFVAMRQAETVLRHADTVEAMGMLPALADRWGGTHGESVREHARATSRSQWIASLSRFSRLVLQVGILSAGAWLVIGDLLTPGGMIAGSILMARALAPLEQSIGAWRSLVAARDAYGRVRAQLAAAAPHRESMSLPNPVGSLACEGLVYGHPGATTPLLRGLDFCVGPGELLGIVGPSGAGKSTLLRLLAGNLVPRAGSIRLDGMNLAEWTSEARGPYIGYLPQEPCLFAGSVGENIARMAQGDGAAVVAAARLAGVHDLILTLPAGYDTRVGEGGLPLSGGQRQWIALARAVYGESRLILLDEPNANLDAEGERALVDALAGLKRAGRTLLVVAHRPGLLQHADRVLLLREGVGQLLEPRRGGADTTERIASSGHGTGYPSVASITAAARERQG